MILLYLIQLLFNILLILALYALLKRYADKLNLIDHPNIRSSHSKPTIKGFGIIIFISVYSTLIIFHNLFFIENILLLSSILVVTVLGLLDDVKEVSPTIKIAYLIIAYVLLYLDGYLIGSLGVFLGVELDLSNTIAILFTLFSVVSFTNALNLTDGLDGLLGLVSIAIFGSFLVVGYMNSSEMLIVISALYISSFIVFLFFNWHPSKVFLGDSGSLMTGFVISILGIKSLDFIEPVAILYIAAIPIFDSIIVFSRRISKRLSPFFPDKSHMHHILLYCFQGDVIKTVITIFAIQVVFSVAGVVVVAYVEDSFISLTLFILLTISLYKLLTKRYLIQMQKKS